MTRKGIPQSEHFMSILSLKFQPCLIFKLLPLRASSAFVVFLLTRDIILGKFLNPPAFRETLTQHEELWTNGRTDCVLFPGHPSKLRRTNLSGCQEKEVLVENSSADHTIISHLSITCSGNLGRMFLLTASVTIGMANAHPLHIRITHTRHHTPYTEMMNTIHTVWTGHRLVIRAPSVYERTNTENSDYSIKQF